MSIWRGFLHQPQPQVVATPAGAVANPTRSVLTCGGRTTVGQDAWVWGSAKPAGDPARSEVELAARRLGHPAAARARVLLRRLRSRMVGEHRDLRGVPDDPG